MGEEGNTTLAGGAGSDTLADGSGTDNGNGTSDAEAEGKAPADENDAAEAAGEEGEADDSDDGEGNWGAGAYSGDADSGPKDPEDGKWLLDWIPVLGELRSAKEAREEFAAAREASEAGDQAAADEHRTKAYLAILGAIPGLGKLAKAKKAGKAAKAGERSAKTAKTGRAAEGTISGGRIEHFADTADFEAFAKRTKERTPLGFKDREEVARVASDMQAKLKAAGYGDTRIMMRGSSVTGRKFNGETGKYDGRPFGPKSDHDYALVDGRLFDEKLDKLKELGVEIRGNGTRTHKLSDEELKDLGLKHLLPKSAGGETRRRSVVIYRDMESLEKRGPYIPLNP